MTLGLVRRCQIVYFFEGFQVVKHPTTNDPSTSRRLAPNDCVYPQALGRAPLMTND